MTASPKWGYKGGYKPPEPPGTAVLYPRPPWMYPMPLTDAACRNASCPPDRKQARYADAGGLYLEVSASGSRRWFWKFRIAGVEKKFALGSYPDVSLAAA